MTIGQVTDHPLLGYTDDRRLARAVRRGRLPMGRQIVAGAAWILLGALLGTGAIGGGAWVLAQVIGTGETVHSFPESR